MIDQDKIMVDAGGNIMWKTPQEAYDLIENMAQHHYQWDSEVHTTTDMSAYYLRLLSHQVNKLSPTPSSDSIIASPSPSLTPLGDSDSLLEETDAFLALNLIPPGIDNEIFDAERDILLLENLLNIDSTKDLPPQELNNDSEGDFLFF
ncbi:hypothetical protein Tco_0896420 [Tanacetum coccineum]